MQCFEPGAAGRPTTCLAVTLTPPSSPFSNSLERLSMWPPSNTHTTLQGHSATFDIFTSHRLCVCQGPERLTAQQRLASKGITSGSQRGARTALTETMMRHYATFSSPCSSHGRIMALESTRIMAPLQALLYTRAMVRYPAIKTIDVSSNFFNSS